MNLETYKALSESAKVIRDLLGHIPHSPASARVADHAVVVATECLRLMEEAATASIDEMAA